MMRIERCIAALLAGLVIACGSERGGEEVSTPHSAEAEAPAVTGEVPTPAPPEQTEAPPDLPDVPRDIATIWAEMIEQRARIDQLFEEEKILEIASVLERMVQLNRGVVFASGDFDRHHQTRIRRAASFLKVRLGRVHSAAKAQIPGAVRARMSDLDKALRVLESHLPEDSRGGASFPPLSARTY